MPSSSVGSKRGDVKLGVVCGKVNPQGVLNVLLPIMGFLENGGFKTEPALFENYANKKNTEIIV